MQPAGRLKWISGPVVKTSVDGTVGLSEQVYVGNSQLLGEVIALEGDQAVVQVYEETSGLRPDEPLVGCGEPLSLSLGPGLMGSIYDGLQRPLEVLRGQQGIFLRRGARADALPNKRWHFRPSALAGEVATPGTLLGEVQETPLIRHRILVPPGREGQLIELAPEGDYELSDTIATIRDGNGTAHPQSLVQRWPIRRERPVQGRLLPSQPLITGQRVLDTFLPLAKGGTAALPGPFGTGKTILQHSLAKWCNAQVIVYVGCGERGNEMAEVLQTFPRLKDPASGHPLMERTILIANTSNMPVAAREASIFTGITLAEYYRDQGYHVALMADSTSRWAEALREIGGRLEEMPAEEGYPAYLPSRLAVFYERAGVVRTLGGAEGSVSIIGAISPPGGDFTEPVTQHTQRFVRANWELDRTLASARHYPAINWRGGYSFYGDAVTDWWARETAENWAELRAKASQLLEQDARLEQLVRLVGAEALPGRQRWVLRMAHALREGFLQQNAYHELDAYCSPVKQVRLLKLFVELYELGLEVLDSGIPLERLNQELPFPRLLQLRETVANENAAEITAVAAELKAQLTRMIHEKSGASPVGAAEN